MHSPKNYLRKIETDQNNLDRVMIGLDPGSRLDSEANKMRSGSLLECSRLE
jgi:hypothetical protein